MITYQNMSSKRIVTAHSPRFFGLCSCDRRIDYPLSLCCSPVHEDQSYWFKNRSKGIDVMLMLLKDSARP